MPNPSYTACTIVARNYLAQAEVLASSFAEHHPDLEFVTLVIDGTDADRLRTRVGRVVTSDELGLDPAELHQMMGMYDVVELSTALKPALLMSLVREGHSAVAYFDPDIKFYGDVSDLFELAREEGILLTPHTLAPVPRDSKLLSETIIMQAGMYNLGFLAVGASAYRFLSWWHERLRTDAIVDVARALFTDQRWIDWVPSLFPTRILRDPGLNAAYWNLHDREIRLVGDTWFAGEAPLRFFHFSGYDPATPWLLSKHMGDEPRTLLSEHPDLALLCVEYADDLLAAGHVELRENAYRFAELPNGFPLSIWIRRFYRDAVLGVIDLPDPPPDPFADPDDFCRWLARRCITSGSVSFAPLEVYWWSSREDLRGAFGHPLGAGSARFREWLDLDAWAVEQFRPLVAYAEADSAVEPSVAPRALRSFGWSVLAYASSELGVGEAGRRLSALVMSTGVPSELVQVPMGHLSRQHHTPDQHAVAQAGFHNQIACVNADQLANLYTSMDLSMAHGIRVGFWFWELSAFPEQYFPALDLVHEIWVASEFSRAAIQGVTDKTVRRVRLPIPLPSGPTSFTRRSLGIPDDKHVILTNFDYLSVYRRKNPAGVIDAYRRAFGPDDGAVLIVKSINGARRPLDVEHVRSLAGGRSDIRFLEDYLSSAAMQAMIELSDTYVSLHRAEGYGLNIADSMAVGTPVVATAYSGSMEFTAPGTVELVPYELVPVGAGNAPYPVECHWAEPDLDAAAAAMRHLFDEPGAASSLAAAARAHLAGEFAPSRAAAEISQLLIGLDERVS